MQKFSITAAAWFAAMTPGIAAAADFGALAETLLKSQSLPLFGFTLPLATSAVDPNGSDPSRTVDQPASEQISLASGLQVRYLTRDAGNSTDMIAFWPTAQNPTHLITCVEAGRGTLSDGTGRYNPSVQRIRLSDGQVETVLRGMDRCDGIRTTPWGTILATEETGDGRAYEILDPLAITNYLVTSRDNGTIVDANGAGTDAVAQRRALPTMAWEGLAVLSTGVVIGGDELRPGSTGADGGAIFKFVPAAPRLVAGNISSLSESPLVAGAVYAMQVRCQGEIGALSNFGQGCEIGTAQWIAVNALTARADANTNGATGYYRPEDLHNDLEFVAPAEYPNAARFCWTNTGDADVANYGEVVCGIDLDPVLASSNVQVNRFVEGDPELNQPDNFEFQPRTGNHYVIEDNLNGDIWACLPDGVDRDIKSDGCVRMLSVVDRSAEPTGFIFSADGRTAYLSIQHSDDANMPTFDGFRTDDVLVITGFRVSPRR